MCTVKREVLRSATENIFFKKSTVLGYSGLCWLIARLFKRLFSHCFLFSVNELYSSWSYGLSTAALCKLGEKSTLYNSILYLLVCLFVRLFISVNLPRLHNRDIKKKIYSHTLLLHVITINTMLLPCILLYLAYWSDMKKNGELRVLAVKMHCYVRLYAVRTVRLLPLPIHDVWFLTVLVCDLVVCCCFIYIYIYNL